MELEINSTYSNEELKKNYNVIFNGIKSRFKVIDFYSDKIDWNKISKKEELIEYLKEKEISNEDLKYILTISPLNFTGIYKL